MSTSIWKLCLYGRPSVDVQETIGRLVYNNFNPQTLGIIRQVRLGKNSETRPSFDLEIEWPDGSRTWQWWLDVNDFQSLINDHSKKLANHEKRKKKALENFAKKEVIK
jgi:hypothetical protein